MQKLSLIIMGALVLTACSLRRNDEAHAPSHRNFFDAVFNTNSYGEAFDKWTKRGRTQSDFDLTLLADVTFWNDEMQRAYVNEMTRRFRLTDTESKALAYKKLSENDGYYVFIISATTRHPEWNDLDSHNGLWRLSLENKDSSVRIPAERVDKVSYKNERARYFYRRMNRFNETYKVFFPKVKLMDAEEIVLHIAGPRGDLSFDFKIPGRVDENRWGSSK